MLSSRTRLRDTGIKKEMAGLLRKAKYSEKTVLSPLGILVDLRMNAHQIKDEILKFLASFPANHFASDQQIMEKFHLNRTDFETYIGRLMKDNYVEHRGRGNKVINGNGREFIAHSGYEIEYNKQYHSEQGKWYESENARLAFENYGSTRRMAIWAFIISIISAIISGWQLWKK